MSTAICLFTEIWEESIRLLPPMEAREETRFGHRIRTFWEDLAAAHPGCEFILFMPGVLDVKDWFPVSFRRFVRIGVRPEDITRNAMELMFEKQFPQVVFVEAFSLLAYAEVLGQLRDGLARNPVALLPDTEGKIAGLGLNRNALSTWNLFDFSQPEAVVEALSDCLAKNLRYSLLPSRPAPVPDPGPFLDIENRRPLATPGSSA